MLFTLGLTALALLPAQESHLNAARRPAPTAPLPEIQREVRQPNRREMPRAAPGARTAAEAPPAIRRPQSPAGANELDALPAISTEGRHNTLHHDQVGDAHWVRGRTYKASASPDGFTYIPFLGSEAPRNFPVRFRLESVERSGATFNLAPKARVTRDGSRLTLDRGDVEVRYDLDLESVEQSFAFDARGGSGDVTLRLLVESELEVDASGATLRFANDLGGMTYSEAIVLDGTGRTAAVTSLWRDGGIDLTVPAAFVDSAPGPIVVDPIMSTVFIDGFLAELTYPDLAYEEATDTYLVVYEEVFSGNDRDIFSQSVTANGGSVVSNGYIDSSDVSWNIPKVAQQRSTGRYLVIAGTSSIAQPGSTDISARFRLADGTLEAPFILKSATPDYSCIDPDIGGESVTISPSFFCLVYSRDYGLDFDVAAVVLDSSGNPVNSEISLASFVNRDEYFPSVSRSTGSDFGATRWNVAWATRDLNTNENKVEAAQLSFAGGTVYGPFDVTPFTAAVDLYFDVQVSTLSNLRHPTTGQQYWTVTYDDAPSGVSDSFVALCSGTNVHSTEMLQVIEHHPMGANENDLVIGTLNEYFIFVYQVGGEVLATIAQPIGDRLGMTERRISSVGSDAGLGSLAMATTPSGGGGFDDGLIVWHQFDGSDTDIASAFVQAEFTFKAAGTQYCYGVPNSTGDHGYMFTFGDRDPFSPQTLFVSSLPLNTFGFFLASTSQGLAPGAGGSQGTICLSGSVGRFGTFNSGTGGRGIATLNPQSIAQPNGAVSALSGQTWNFQTWHRDSVGGASTSNFSNAVAISFL